MTIRPTGFCKRVGSDLIVTKLLKYLLYRDVAQHYDVSNTTSLIIASRDVTSRAIRERFCYSDERVQ